MKLKVFYKVILCNSNKYIVSKRQDGDLKVKYLQFYRSYLLLNKGFVFYNILFKIHNFLKIPFSDMALYIEKSIKRQGSKGIRQWLINEPTNQNSLTVPKVVKPKNKEMLL